MTLTPLSNPDASLLNIKSVSHFDFSTAKGEV